MEKSKKHALYVFALLFFVAYLFSANYIFNVLIKTDHEARIARIILPSETNKIKFAIDAVYREKLKWKDALLIKGWAFRENTVKKDRELFLVLRSIVKGW